MKQTDLNVVRVDSAGEEDLPLAPLERRDSVTHRRLRAVEADDELPHRRNDEIDEAVDILKGVLA